MNLVMAENITKSYSEKVLFNDIGLSINEGEKIGVIGVNGTGKTTLLRIISGEEVADTGKITRASSMTIGYLKQEPEFKSGISVIEQVFEGDFPVMKLLRKYEKLMGKIEKDASNIELQEKLINLNVKMDELNAWSLESEAKIILTRLGITDFDKDVNLLSGGQKKRVAMASALINPVDLLILDEPTNHIDNDTVDWLEEMLCKRKGALLMVTHDRYFLDRVTNKIVEVDQGRLFSYMGNYSNFLEQKSLRLENEQGVERKRQTLLKRELEWVRRGAKARTTKQKARLDRYDELASASAIAENGNININTGAARLGRKTVEINNISKSYDKLLIKDFSYIILRDDRIGIIGENGSGKSTLLNMISQSISPDMGSIDIGDTVETGIFTQQNEEIDENKRVIEYIKDVAEYIETKDGKLSASQMLENFLFPSHLQWTMIRKLSGGEKRRLYLLKILMAAPNLLLLDEPTNDLDIETLTILENYLENFPGMVIVVSHDRYFLDRVVGRIFAFIGNGQIKQYEGGYSDYKEKHDMEIDAPKETIIKQVIENRVKEKKIKFTYKEQKEYETIDDDIVNIEDKITKNAKDMEIYASDFTKLQELMSKKEVLEKEQERLMDRWVYLGEIAEQMK